MAFFFVFIITGVSFLRERSQGTMERLLASPLSQFEIIVGYLFGFLLFALAQTGVIIFFVFYLLKIHYLGHLASVLAVEFLVVLIASNMGIFFSSFAKNEFQVAQFVPLVVLPQVFLSGMLWSVESMPKALQYLAYALPLTYANLALQKPHDQRLLLRPNPARTRGAPRVRAGDDRGRHSHHPQVRRA